MTTPSQVERIVNFQQEEQNAVSGRSTVRTSQLDAEHNAFVTAINHLIANLSILQRDDTRLKDSVVWVGSLAADVLALLGSAGFTINNPLTWSGGVAYAARSIVVNGTGTYVCAVAHTSGTFATDLAAGKWAILYDSAGGVFVPTDTIAATTVAGAINEVDSELRAQNFYLNTRYGAV